MLGAVDLGRHACAVPGDNVNAGQSLPDLANFEPWIPPEFRNEVAGRDPEPQVDGDTWLRSLPRLVRDCALQWNLTPGGPVYHGVCAIVLPVVQDGVPAALKVSWPHTEAEHEHLALRAWDGCGAVRLLAADPPRAALLLERLDPERDLNRVDLLESCETIGALIRELDRPALPQLRAVEAMADRWLGQLDAAPDSVPRRLTTQAASTLQALIAQPLEHRLVHQDLHFENVLAADRQPWLAIDPKPIAAPWEFAVAPALWNRWEDAAAAHNVRAHLRLRLGLICEAAGLDEETARAWTFVRVVLNAVWATEDLPDTRDFISHMLVVAKAMSD